MGTRDEEETRDDREIERQLEEFLRIIEGARSKK
jgi:hypothetical protein